MSPQMALLVGIGIGVSLTVGGWWLVVWCVTADMDDAGWMRGGDD